MVEVSGLLASWVRPLQGTINWRCDFQFVSWTDECAWNCWSELWPYSRVARGEGGARCTCCEPPRSPGTRSRRDQSTRATWSMSAETWSPSTAGASAAASLPGRRADGGCCCCGCSASAPIWDGPSKLAGLPPVALSTSGGGGGNGRRRRRCGGGARVGSRWNCKPPRGGRASSPPFIGGEMGSLLRHSSSLPLHGSRCIRLDYVDAVINHFIIILFWLIL